MVAIMIFCDVDVGEWDLQLTTCMDACSANHPSEIVEAKSINVEDTEAHQERPNPELGGIGSNEVKPVGVQSRYSNRMLVFVVKRMDMLEEVGIAVEATVAKIEHCVIDQSHQEEPGSKVREAVPKPQVAAADPQNRRTDHLQHRTCPDDKAGEAEE